MASQGATIDLLDQEADAGETRMLLRALADSLDAEHSERQQLVALAKRIAERGEQMMAEAVSWTPIAR